MTASLADCVVRWQRTHGRHGLPWQQTRDPYRVWLSEIMLQQTQVSTVLEYYPRFLARFPTVAALAQADQDEVLGLWSGLGYYTRARNLHACAVAVQTEHGGCFPSSAAVLQTLPGIGRSTAAAIAAFCFSERAAILDGNVKRVLGRALGFSDDLAVAAHERALWQQAEALLPEPADMATYTQGLMDLGATVCTPRRPSCLLCPLQSTCVAHASGEPERYPVRTRKLKRKSESWWLLLAVSPQGDVWLEPRPPKGIWAGLQCLPVFDGWDALRASVPPALCEHLEPLPPFLHVLTHRDLHLHVVRCDWKAVPTPVSQLGRWWHSQEWAGAGLPAPVRKCLTGSVAV